jgi:hypothetical protein
MGRERSNLPCGIGAQIEKVKTKLFDDFGILISENLSLFFL